MRSGLVVRASSVASYLAQDGEVNLNGLHHRLLTLPKALLLPVLRQDGKLHFSRYTDSTRLVENRFGIPEPQCFEWLHPKFISLVLMPLVGFDNHGYRLGMGGGYYDRTFNFVMRASRFKRPKLIGVAYELQRCEALKSNPWDVPLDGIVTEAGLQLFPSSGEQ